MNALPTIAIGGNVLDKRYYTGLIDEVKIFDAVLEEQEIKQVSAATPVESQGKLAVTWAETKKR